MVKIFTGAVNFQIATRLDGIDDWGIILNPAETGKGATFYPWRLVVAMRLAREEDLATPSECPDSPSIKRQKTRQRGYISRPGQEGLANGLAAA